MPQALDDLPFQIDHIIARKHLGPTVLENLALACFPCNNSKGPNIAGFDWETRAVIPLFHPRRDNWADHFTWDGPELRGTTPLGRVTVAVLDINRAHRVALRQALAGEGLFPPAS
jgi:5-methylcytosine-specific restriction endonuclease McrA